MIKLNDSENMFEVFGTSSGEVKEAATKLGVLHDGTGVKPSMLQTILDDNDLPMNVKLWFTAAFGFEFGSTCN